MAEISNKLANELAQAFIVQEYPDVDMGQVDVRVRPAENGEPANVSVYLREDKDLYRIIATDHPQRWQVQERGTSWFSGDGCGASGKKRMTWDDETTLELPMPEVTPEPVAEPVEVSRVAAPVCKTPASPNTDESLLYGQRALCDAANTLCVVADASFTDAAQQYTLEKIARIRDEELGVLGLSAPYAQSLRVYLLNENAEAAKEAAGKRAAGWAVNGIVHLALDDDLRDRINTTDDRFTAVLDDMIAHELGHGLGNTFLWSARSRGLEEGRASWMQRQMPARERFAEAMVPARELQKIDNIPMNSWTEVPAASSGESLPLPISLLSVMREQDAAPNEFTLSYQFSEMNAEVERWGYFSNGGTARIQLGQAIHVGPIGLMLEQNPNGSFTATLVDDAPEHRRTQPTQFSCTDEGWKAEQASYIVLEDGRELSAPLGGYTLQGDELSFADTIQLIARGQEGLAAYPHYYCFFEALGDDVTRELLQRIDLFAQAHAEQRGEFPFFASVQELSGWDESKTREVFTKFAVAESDSDYLIGGICYPEVY